MATLAEQMASLAVLDTLKHASIPASFTKLPWAGTAALSWSEVNGWEPNSFLETAVAKDNSGVYWNAAEFEKAAATAFQMLSNSPAEKRSYDVWVFGQVGNEKPNGYQLIATCTVIAEKKYTLKLVKWVEGAETVLGTTENVVIENTGSIGISVFEGKVSGWSKKTSAEAWVQQVAPVSDLTFTKGRSGIGGNGSNPFFINFAAGSLVEPNKESTANQVVPAPHRGLIMSGRRSQ